jgi:hypothetical protein
MFSDLLKSDRRYRISSGFVVDTDPISAKLELHIGVPMQRFPQAPSKKTLVSK